MARQGDGAQVMATAAWVAAPPCAAAAALADGLDLAPWIVVLPALAAIALTVLAAWCLDAGSRRGNCLPVGCAVALACALGRWSEAALAAVLSALALMLAMRAQRRGRCRLDAATLLPRRGRAWRGGRWVRCAAASLRRGELARVLPGERIAGDGRVCAGSGDVDQRALTGERARVTKVCGDPLYAGCRNGAQVLDYEVGAAAPASLLARSAAARLRGLAREATPFAQWPRIALAGTLGGAAVVLLAPGLAGYALPAWRDALARVPVLLAVAWPFALALGVPACTASALAAAARRGIVFDGAETLRRVAAATEVVLDGVAADARVELDGWQLLGVRHAPSRLLGIVRGLVECAPSSEWAPLATAFDAPVCVPTRSWCEAAGGVAGHVDGVEYRLGEPRWVLGGAALPSPLRSLVQLHRARACRVALLGDAEGALALFALSRGVSPRLAAACDALARLGVRGTLASADAASRAAPRIVFDAAARGVTPDAAAIVVLAADPARAVDAVRLARRACAGWRQGRGVALCGKAALLALALDGSLTMPLALLAEIGLSVAVLGLAQRVRRVA